MFSTAKLTLIAIVAPLLAQGCTTATATNAAAIAPLAQETASAAATATKSVPAKAAGPKITMGNGDKNWIVVDGAVRNNKTLTFKEVQIDGNGWLVMHPFENGKPNGDKYVAATYVESGTNKNVDIEVLKGAATGELFIVMLHRDLNENKVLDFVFVDDTNVMDKAVFEGTTMIGHVVPAP